MSQEVQRNVRAERETEARAEKGEGNILHRHLSERRNTRKTHLLRGKTLALIKSTLVPSTETVVPSVEIPVQNCMKI